MTDPDSITRRGVLFVLSSPSGAGKTSISRRLLDRDKDLTMSVSVTTRPPRPSEVDGRDYHFIDRAAFDRMVAAGGLLEHAQVFGHGYGTPRAPVEAALESGRDVLFDIDWQGTQQLAQVMPNDIVRVFVLPPSRAELHDRLRRRAQDSEAVVAQRMARAFDEASHFDAYDYVVINRDLDRAVEEVYAVLVAERLRRGRQQGLADFVNRLRGGP
ncbi:MAG: guanylate kinase [Rhodospirillales bacterium]